MTIKQKTQLISRSKSLAWRTGMMALAFVIPEAVDGLLPIFNISPELSVFIGLIAGEVSKFLNSKK